MDEVERIIERLRSDIDAGRPTEEVFQDLLPHLGQNRERATSVAESLATIPHVEAAKLLQRMWEVSEEKVVRKTIKRSLYRLKSKGISVGEVSVDKGRPILRPLQTDSPKGFGGGIDPLGQRLLLLAIPHPGRGWVLLEGVVSDTKELVSFSGGEVGRKGLKTLLKEVQKGGPSPMVEMEPSYVAFLFVEAYRQTLQQGGTSPQAYFGFKTEIENLKKDYARPLIYSFLRSDEVTEGDRFRSRAGELLKVDLFADWRIDEDLIRPYAEAVQGAETSKIVLTQIQKEARFQEIYQKALSELFSGDRREVYKRRLEEMAYVLLKRGKEEEAKICVAVALDLEKPLTPFQPNPFLSQWVTRSIATLLAEDRERKGQEPSLIIRP
ncbi:MAG: hypothetical protein MUO29_02405 [Desulfobacterales bacterium]|nr:hypothetical protein [Desulfobacterales bacterium]